jgi:ketosteroid isomerase-like protein
MTEQQNVGLVREAYAAFGRGDIPGLLATLDDQIVWEPVLGAASHVPTAGKRSGKQQVAEFFRTLNDNVAFSTFEPREFIAQGDHVVALGRYEARAKPTGRTFQAEWAMVFKVRNGKVTEFREYVATSAIDAAFDAAGV